MPTQDFCSLTLALKPDPRQHIVSSYNSTETTEKPQLSRHHCNTVYMYLTAAIATVVNGACLHTKLNHPIK